MMYQCIMIFAPCLDLLRRSEIPENFPLSLLEFFCFVLESSTSNTGSVETSVMVSSSSSSS